MDKPYEPIPNHTKWTSHSCFIHEVIAFCITNHTHITLFIKRMNREYSIFFVLNYIQQIRLMQFGYMDWIVTLCLCSWITKQEHNLPLQPIYAISKPRTEENIITFPNLLYCTNWELCDIEQIQIYFALALHRNKSLRTGPMCVFVSGV